MNVTQTLVLSVVEGFSEFLPISSTGHLILTANLMKITQTEFVKSFEIVIQLGAILAVVVLYWKKLWNNFKLWKQILIAFIPSAAIGFIFYGFIKQNFIGNTTVVVWSLFLGGIFMIIFEKYYKQKKVSELSTLHFVLIGVSQSISMIPGVSRAMATIFGGMVVGMDRKRATEFSFLLAIPTMLGATALDLYKTNIEWSNGYIVTMAIGLLGAFITALFTIKWLIKFVESHNFIWFGVYRIILALVSIFMMLAI